MLMLSLPCNATGGRDVTDSSYVCRGATGIAETRLCPDAHFPPVP